MFVVHCLQIGQCGSLYAAKCSQCCSDDGSNDFQNRLPLQLVHCLPPFLFKLNLLLLFRLIDNAKVSTFYEPAITDPQFSGRPNCAPHRFLSRVHCLLYFHTVTFHKHFFSLFQGIIWKYETLLLSLQRPNPKTEAKAEAEGVGLHI